MSELSRHPDSRRVYQIQKRPQISQLILPIALQAVQHAYRAMLKKLWEQHEFKQTTSLV